MNRVVQIAPDEIEKIPIDMKQLLLRNKISILILSLLLSVCFPLSGQTRVQRYFDKSQQYFRSGDYKNAVAEAKKALESDPGFVNAALLLSDIYHDLDSVGLEIEYLKKALPFSTNPVIQVRLGDAFYRIGDYTQALTHFEKYLETGSATDKRKEEIIRKTQNCQFAIGAIRNPVEFQPEPLNSNINTADDEYWPYLSVDQQKLVFTRLLKHPGKMPQEDLYFSELDSTGWGPSIPIAGINSSMMKGRRFFRPTKKSCFSALATVPTEKEAAIFTIRFGMANSGVRPEMPAARLTQPPGSRSPDFRRITAICISPLTAPVDSGTKISDGSN
jgi:tetratricopeptide (TPR) repeat protein